MVAVSNAGTGIVRFFLGLYLTLWSFTKATMGGVYRAVFMLSTVYPPAKKFLTNLEHTMNLVKNDPSEVKLQNLLQEYWTPATTLEGLGQISVAAPLSLAVLCITSFVLLACVVVTCIFAFSMTLCLPVSLCCALGYIIGTATQQLVGLGVSGVSAFRFAMSQVFRRAKSGKTTSSKANISLATDIPDSDKTNSAVPEEDLPNFKIAAVVLKDEMGNVESVQ